MQVQPIETMPQQATGLEKLVLGAIMSRSCSLEELLQEVKLTPEMFYNTAHQTIFSAILDCNPNDLWTITQYLNDKGKLEEIGGAIPLAELVKYGSTNGEAINHAKIIHQKFISRQAGKILYKAHGRCQSTDDIADIIDDLKNDLTNLIPDPQDENQFRIDFTAEPAPAPALLYLRNSVKDKLIPSFTLQNFSLITGKAKSRKTFLTVLLVASYLGYLNNIIHADHERKGTVLFIDTEQSPYHLHRMMKRICELIGEENPGRLQAYGLKTLTPEEKRKFIENKIRTTPEIIMVVIDGIRDLVYDINSPEEATKTSVLLMKWCASYNIHILNVLHQNKADGNARGHLGSELVNKAETVLSVNLDGDKTISTVDSEYSREMDFDTFSFKVNEDSLPEICNTPEEEKPIKRSEPHLVPKERHFIVLDRIYKIHTERKYQEICMDIHLGFADEGMSVGLNKAREFLAFYIKQEWISKDEIKKCYKYERATF